MAWIGAITNAGARLLAECAGGSKLTLNRAAAGTGTVEDIAILAQTGLVEEKQTASIVSSKKTDSGQRIRIQLGAAEESYTLQQIGLYAGADEGAPVLMALFQNPQGVAIPSADESPDFLYVFNGTLDVSNQVEIQVTVDSGAYVTQGTLEEYVVGQMIVHTDNRQNPHGVTKDQVGLGNVDNTSDTNKPVSVAQAAAIADAKKAGTDAQANLTAHNTNTSAHADLRSEMKALADRINAALDSDDETLDELSEIVAYIKSNKSLIEAITTSKVSVADIVNDLVSNVTNKPLSAAQGVALKALIDKMTTESWTFTLEDGSTVTKAVYVG